MIDSYSYLLTCHRYIELNPVRAGLVKHPIQYPWSSHAHYAAGAKSALITRHTLFDQLTGGREGFLSQFGSEINSETLERIRVAAKRGWALGSESFLDEVERQLGRSARPPKRGRPFKDKNHSEAEPSEMLI